MGENVDARECLFMVSNVVGRTISRENKVLRKIFGPLRSEVKWVV